MKISPAGLALIKACEGFRGTAYRDGSGVWTIVAVPVTASNLAPLRPPVSVITVWTSPKTRAGSGLPNET